MGKGGGGPSDEELANEMQMNRETIASNEKMAQAYLDASKAQAEATLKAGQAQADAAIKSSQNAALGGVLGAALGAHTTHEEIKQWLPHEAGAAMMQSWEMARMWNKAREMRESGYQEAAIQWELGGKKGNDLFTDSQWRSLDMASQTLGDMKHAASVFGIKSASNPAGVAISPEEWINMNSFKDPSELLQVDPQVAAARQAQFDQWEQQMRASGNGLVVDIYKNPQLGGSSILTMKGKDPLLDPSLAPLLKGLMGDQTSGAKSGSGGGGTNWDQAISALTQGEQNPMTEQIKKAMEIGLVDKYGMVNAGVLQSFIPPELAEAPEFNPRRELSPQEKIALQDQYNRLAEIQVDPKLVREINQGFGVTKYVKYNEDGTEAASFLEGMMRDPMTGAPIQVRMQGSRLQEFYDRMSAIDLMGPTFPGMRAPVTQEQLSGRRPTNNLYTQWNNGEKGQGETMATKQTMGGSLPAPQGSGDAPAQKVVAGSSGGGEQKPTAGTLSKSLVTQTSKPAGYDAAPLAAGGDE